jgi:hypothetical protein
MRSSGSSEPLSLDPDLPTTPPDVAALARAGSQAVTGLASYFVLLAGSPPASPAELRARRGPRGAPFELIHQAGRAGQVTSLTSGEQTS